MKKLSKSKRKKLKAKEEHSKLHPIKPGIPYSKHILRTCLHYACGFSFLRRQYDGKYVCLGCKHVFSEEDNQKINILSQLMNKDVIFTPLIEKYYVKPITYYYESPGKIVEVDGTKTDMDAYYLQRSRAIQIP